MIDKQAEEKLDKIVTDLQEFMLDGYSQSFKSEFLHPKNIGTMDGADCHVSITGVCGDTVEMSLSIENGRIADVKFMTDGCGATIGCASYVTGLAKGRLIEEALQIRPEDVDDYFKGLPEEHKHCAKLAVITLEAAIREYQRKSDE